MAERSVTLNVTLDAATARRLDALAGPEGSEFLIAELIANFVGDAPGFGGVADSATRFDYDFKVPVVGRPGESLSESSSEFKNADAAQTFRREQAEIALAEYDQTGVAYPLAEVMAELRGDVEAGLAKARSR